MNKPTKTSSPKPLFIAELATVAGGGRGPTTRLFPGENGRGTSRVLGEEGNPPDGISE